MSLYSHCSPEYFPIMEAYVYIMTNQHHNVLYTGVTNNLDRRVFEHIRGMSVFTTRYKIKKLVYYEAYSSIKDAIYREKVIKRKSRNAKKYLINTVNPDWKDLFLAAQQ